MYIHSGANLVSRRRHSSFLILKCLLDRWTVEKSLIPRIKVRVIFLNVELGGPITEHPPYHRAPRNEYEVRNSSAREVNSISIHFPLIDLRLVTN